jgi:predicted Zn-dependent protease
LDAYREGDFAGAEQQLREASGRYPGTGEVQLYWGISLLFLGRSSEAIEALTNARRLTEGSLQQDAAWYLALAYQRSGATDLASEELRGLCQGGGAGASRACAGLQELAESSQQTAPR